MNSLEDPLWENCRLDKAAKEQLDFDGHYAFPGVLNHPTQKRLTEALAAIEDLRKDEARFEGPKPIHMYAAEYNEYLASLVAHPQLLKLARDTLGDDIRYDHTVTLNRHPGSNGAGWHSHGYAEDDPSLGFVRIFFYVNGFEASDSALKVVPGSHHYRDAEISAGLKDEDLRENWLAGKRHPLSGEPLRIEKLVAPPGTIILMWTHAAHAVTSRISTDSTRWTVVYAYRNPGRESGARQISEAFEANPPDGAEGLMSLY
ncbi:MAG: phytanoyl-CoA dioxygenase family protein [Planctomycetota bacterium]|nr:phytanoyl-CoA dioxygenase family protein [Planctomycetota bacterium]MDA1137698.1 phytanoyl-CoA dioxygenase family protein [Planctomycetota bacterium]